MAEIMAQNIAFTVLAWPWPTSAGTLLLRQQRHAAMARGPRQWL